MAVNGGKNAAPSIGGGLGCVHRTGYHCLPHSDDKDGFGVGLCSTDNPKATTACICA